MKMSFRLRAAIVSVALLVALLGAWHIATSGAGQTQAMDPEYAKLMGLTATQGKSDIFHLHLAAAGMARA